jgi:cupin 2 domain-containing protein
MAEAQLQQFLEKVRQLNAFVALSEADPDLRKQLRDCEHHDQVVALARRCGFEIGRRWGEPPSGETLADRPAANAAAGVSGLVSGFESPRSLLAGACPPPGEEHTEVLFQTPLWRLERMHSCAYSSPDGFWYEQAEEEWVLLLQGTAGLRFEDQPCDLQLKPGDSLAIRSGRRHRLTMTDPAPGTIWLALFWRKA